MPVETFCDCTLVQVLGLFYLESTPPASWVFPSYFCVTPRLSCGLPCQPRHAGACSAVPWFSFLDSSSRDWRNDYKHLSFFALGSESETSTEPQQMETSLTGNELPHILHSFFYLFTILYALLRSRSIIDVKKLINIYLCYTPGQKRWRIIVTSNKV